MKLMSVVGDYWRWWCLTLLSVLPSRYRRREGKMELLISLGYARLRDANHAVNLHDSEAIVALLDASCRELLLELDASCCFKTEFQIPRATLSDIDNIVSYEFDKLTPFNESAVFYAYSIADVDKSADQVSVTLLAVKRDLVLPILQLATEQGLDVTTLRSSAEPALNLLPQSLRQKKKLSIEGLLNIAAAIVFFCALLIPLWQKHQLLGQLVLEKTALQEKIADKNQDFLASKKKVQAIETLWSHKQANIANIALLNDLSILIPADTHLQRLQRKGNKLSLRGESASASALIAQLEASQYISQVRFSAAVTQLPNSTRERFAITAVVSGEL